MIVTCSTCDKRYDDTYHWTFCPHDSFSMGAVVARAGKPDEYATNVEQLQELLEEPREEARHATTAFDKTCDRCGRPFRGNTDLQPCPWCSASPKVIAIKTTGDSRVEFDKFRDAINNQIMVDLARYFEPWKFNDQPRWPAEFVLLPRLKRFEVWQKEWRARIRFCVGVLQFGIPPERVEW